jgi:4-amino-4-deoxy-L-arabinose transferase-like glycosyltransferase
MAINQGEVSATFQSPHPGVTTMLAGAGAYFWKFPKIQRVGSISLGDTRLFQIFERHGPRPMEVLAAARLIVVLINLVTYLFAFYFARKLFGRLVAMLGFLLIAFDPFYLAHTRLLHVDGLLSSFLFLASLAYLSYLQDGKRIGLIIAGIATGFSLLTKTPAIVLFLTTPLLTLSKVLLQRKIDLITWRILFKEFLKPLGIWTALAVVTMILFWPALWVDPIGNLVQSARYILVSAEGEVGGAQIVEGFQSDANGLGQYYYFYPLSYLWRATPIMLIGLMVAGYVLWKRDRLREHYIRFPVLGLLTFVLAYTFLMSLGIKKIDRYLLPIYLPLDLIAAIGWVGLYEWIKSAVKLRYAQWMANGMLLIIVLIQAGLALNHYPYYLTYYNPLIGGIRKAQDVLLIGWGEGLNDAASYLREKPDFQKLKILSWYAPAFNWYSANFRFYAEQNPYMQDNLEQVLADTDYVVVYINQWQRQSPSPCLIT